jgi:hypothetical protein
MSASRSPAASPAEVLTYGPLFIVGGGGLFNQGFTMARTGAAPGTRLAEIAMMGTGASLFLIGTAMTGIGNLDDESRPDEPR